MKEMDRNSAIQVLIGAVMGYVQNERLVSGMDVSGINEVAVHALMLLGVTPGEMRVAIETASFITSNPEAAVAEAPPGTDVDDLLIHWPMS